MTDKITLQGQEEGILTDNALKFIVELVNKFRAPHIALLVARRERQNLWNNGELPDFLEETKEIRTGSWTIAEIPEEILDRRVEITGPTERKMIINALNSGANVFMADFEDSLSPTWKNVINGQINLRDAINKTITYEHPTKGTYKLNDEHAVLFVRPRGLHLAENHFEIDGQIIPASLFDFGLYMYHNCQNLINNGTRPYFYLPKLEHYLEARWWNDVFNWTQDRLGVPRGTVRATVLIETLPAAFQMNEILFELREHSAGLNCGRWDYIFSYIKTLQADPLRVLPNRSEVTMNTHFMKSYSTLLVQTCHQRHAHAMGGMAAQIPIRDNPEANETALQKVREDKMREVLAGHDGTWVAHPGLVKVAKDIFDEHMFEKNQIIEPEHYEAITQEDLLRASDGNITPEALAHNINVGVLYLAAWLRGEGCVPLYNLMEDAATAEISRTQIWQWIKHKTKLNGKTILTKELFEEVFNKEINKIVKTINPDNFQNGKYIEAAKLFFDLTVSNELISFLTLPAYEYLFTNRRTTDER
jgi:malate synthase